MRNTCGFTLIELLVLIAVMTVAVTLGVPAFSHWVAQENRAATALALVHDLRFARSRAITLGRNVTMCKSRDGQHCGGHSVGWHSGWIVYTTRPARRGGRAKQQLLIQHTTLADAVTLTANRNAFTFRPGTIRSTAGSLFICAGHAPVGNAVVVSVTGHVRASKKHAGDTVTCPR